MLQSTTLLSAPKSTLACDPHAHSLSVAENNRLGNRLSSTYIFAAGMKLQSTTLLFAKNCFAEHTKPPAQKQKALRVLLCTRRLRTSGIQSCAGLRTRRFVWTCAYTVSHTGLQSSCSTQLHGRQDYRYLTMSMCPNAIIACRRCESHTYTNTQAHTQTKDEVYSNLD